MIDVRLSKQDKEDLLKFLDTYSKKISTDDINEIETKLSKKLRRLRRSKKLPSFVRKMFTQLKDLVILLDSPTISKDALNRVISALHYFIWAEDRIPDYIPVIGYLDDAFVVSIVYQEVREDISQFKRKKE